MGDDKVLSVSLLPDGPPIIAETEVVEPETTEDTPPVPIPHRILRALAFSLAYLLVLLPITYFSYLIPPSPLFSSSSSNNVLAKWVSVWPWSTFIIWNLAMISGYTFVACITEKRKNPFKSRFGDHYCFIKLLLLSPFIYLVGPVRALHFSSSSLPSSSLNSPPYPAFLYNALFLCSFFVGIQFTYLDYIMLFRTAGDKFGSPSLWKTYTRSESYMIISLVVLIVSIVGWHLYLIGKAGLLLWYLIFYCIVFLALILPTVIFRKSYYLHLHHYAIFGALIPFFAFPNAVSLLLLGVMAGVYVEGIGRWGMAWFWYKGHQRMYN